MWCVDFISSLLPAASLPHRTIYGSLGLTLHQLLAHHRAASEKL